MELKYEEVQDYYGKQLQGTEDLKTNACCTLEAPPSYIQAVLKDIHPEVLDRYYGCGLVIPHELEGLKILDLGSGSGRDSFIAASLVGSKGRVVGVDFTDEQLAVASQHIDYHANKFGYKEPNTQFLKGNLDQLDALGLEENSFDLIVSNCVINLCLDKEKVFKDAFNLLKSGGEFYFSDVYASRRVPQHLQNDPDLWGECLSGALYWNDFLQFAKKAGFTDPRVVESAPITVENKALSDRLTGIEFYSVTYRLFKIDGLESDCEDYGQAVRYKGTIEHSKTHFQMDDHHIFEAGKVVPVCGNSYLMLHATRFNKHFDFFGNFDTHYGIFEGCGVNMPYQEGSNGEEGSSCC